MINYMDGLNDDGAVVRLSQVPLEILIVRIVRGSLMHSEDRETHLWVSSHGSVRDSFTQ